MSNGDGSRTCQLGNDAATMDMLATRSVRRTCDKREEFSEQEVRELYVAKLKRAKTSDPEQPLGYQSWDDIADKHNKNKPINKPFDSQLNYDLDSNVSQCQVLVPDTQHSSLNGSSSTYVKQNQCSN